ncbi:MAG: TatD family hydrolase [Ignavibacteriales bacterium]
MKLTSAKTLFINIHTHKDTCGSGELALINIFAEDFENYLLREGCYYTAGLHPWKIAGVSAEAAINAVRKASVHKNILAIGEAGLDRAIAVPLDVQSELFIAQLQIAEAVKKPLMIHCVRAVSDIIAIRKRFKFTTPWIIHGFNGNSQSAGQLLKHNCYLSFGKFLFNKKSRVPATFPEVPDDLFFLECDDSNMSIEEIYLRACELKNITLEELKLQMAKNFNNLFFRDYE